MTPNLGRLEQRLGQRYSAHTRNAYLSQARRFVDFAHQRSTNPRQAVLLYLDQLVKEGKKRSSITVALAAIRALYEENGIRWEIKERDLHLGLPEEDPEQPYLLPAEVAKLIAGVRGRRGFPATVVCLATIYGLRGDEIARVLGDGCDGKTLTVQTAKLGRKRQHTIPGQLAPYLTFSPTSVSTRHLHTLFEELMRRYVREPVSREGWHALRRTVITGLLTAGVAELEVHRWFGWKSEGGHTIAVRYFKPNPLALDETVYTHHPYLRAWRVSQ